MSYVERVFYCSVLRKSGVLFSVLRKSGVYLMSYVNLVFIVMSYVNLVFYCNVLRKPGVSL